jgi:hypothetical protein
MTVLMTVLIVDVLDVTEKILLTIEKNTSSLPGGGRTFF